MQPQLSATIFHSGRSAFLRNIVAEKLYMPLLAAKLPTPYTHSASAVYVDGMTDAGFAFPVTEASIRRMDITFLKHAS